MDFDNPNLVRRDSIQALFDGYETNQGINLKTISTKGM